MTDTHWQDDGKEPAATPREPIGDPAPARDAARALETIAPLVQYGVMALGAIYAVEAISTLVADRPSLTPEWRMTLRVNIVVDILLYGLIGLAAGRVLAALACVVESQRTRAEAAARTAAWCEHTLTPALARLAQALERPGPAAPSETPPSGAPELLRALRRAIAARDWSTAEEHVRAITASHPDHPEAALLPAELARGREAAVHDLLAQVDAARTANDANRVLDLRDALATLLEGEGLLALDRDLGKWFLHLIQKRLRAGGMRPEIPILVARVAESLAATPEGASLRASLPTLRRSAGLCARCGEPYNGIADACPKCLATTPATAPLPASPHDDRNGDDEPDDQNANGRADDPFLTDEL